VALAEEEEEKERKNKNKNKINTATLRPATSIKNAQAVTTTGSHECQVVYDVANFKKECNTVAPRLFTRVSSHLWLSTSIKSAQAVTTTGSHECQVVYEVFNFKQECNSTATF
jgi:hypothetical protein